MCLNETSTKTKIETVLSSFFLSKNRSLNETSTKTKIETHQRFDHVVQCLTRLNETSTKTKIETPLFLMFVHFFQLRLNETSTKTKIETRKIKSEYWDLYRSSE